MLNNPIITMLVLITPIIIPLIIIGIVKMCDNKKDDQHIHYNFPQQNGYRGYPQPPYPNCPPPPRAYQNRQMSQPSKAPKKHDMTVSNILFLIGTAFVVLSGLAFGVAKWVHTSHEGRVGIILAASAVSFLLSAVVGKFLKLNGTSTSFYVLGSGFITTAFLTSGYYELMGEWLSFGGDGMYALLAIAAGLSAITMFIGSKLFSKLPLIYTALSSTALTALFAVLQISSDLMVTSPIFLALQTIITAAVYGAEIFKGRKYELAVKIIGSCSAFIYGCFPLVYVFQSLRHPTFVSYLILVTIIAQLLLYAKKTKEDVLISINSMVTVFLAYMTSLNIANEAGSRYGILSFCALAVLIYLAHCFIPFIKNAFTESISLLTAVISAFICIFSGKSDAFIPEMLFAAAVSVMIAAYIFHKNEVIQTIAGFTALVIPAFITGMTAYYVSKTYEIDENIAYTAAWSVFAAVLITAAILIAYLPKYAFRFHIKHPRSNDIVLYVNMVISGLILIIVPTAKTLMLVPAVMCFIHFAVSNKLRCNFTAIISAAALLSSVYSVLDAGTQSKLFTTIAFMTVFCIFMALSKLIYNNGVIIKSNVKLIIDPLLLSGWIAICMMYQDTSRNSAFFALIAVGIYCASFIKKNTSKETAAILLTVTSALTALALMLRPFLVPDSKAISWKISIGIVALVGLSCRFIWRQFPSISKYASNSIYLTAFVALLIDALYFDTAVNTIFVMSVMLFVLIISIMARSKTWFTASAASLFTITVYATREYLMALNWWIYLFIAGITLIALAAGNEYCKKNNQTLKSSVAKRFSGWTW